MDFSKLMFTSEKCLSFEYQQTREGELYEKERVRGRLRRREGEKEMEKGSERGREEA